MSGFGFMIGLVIVAITSLFILISDINNIYVANNYFQKLKFKKKLIKIDIKLNTSFVLSYHVRCRLEA